MLYGECLALLTALLWGTIPVVVRKALPYSSASVAVLLGLLASVPLLCLVFSLHPRPVTQAVAPQAAVWFAAVGITGPCLGRVFKDRKSTRLNSSHERLSRM